MTCLFMLCACKTSVKESGPLSLFNGRDLSGWHIDVPKMDSDASLKSPFLVRNGMLVSLGTPGGHLITDKIYKNYKLEVEYRFAGTPGNCGVLVHASIPRRAFQIHLSGSKYACLFLP